MYNINEYVTMIIYANDELFDRSFTIIKIIMKTHLVDDLKVNMFIKNDILIF